jgi:multidrug efflux pump subunit AcrB
MLAMLCILAVFIPTFFMQGAAQRLFAPLAMAVGAGGALSELETTVLLDMDEAQDAMRKAAAATYRPPGS